MGNKFELKTDEILKTLERTYHDAKPGLEFQNPFELLIATILSAQCTDKQVNKCTPALFAAYPNASAMAQAEPSELSQYIKSCGFYNNKTKNILAACKEIVEKYGGEVPSEREALQSLPGVGRKTANVVLSNAFGIPAIAVDTHVFRVSNRLGLADAKNVEKTEMQLMENIPEEKWSQAHHWLIWHGRKVCKARNPECENCTLRELCRYHNENKSENK